MTSAAASFADHSVYVVVVTFEAPFSPVEEEGNDVWDSKMGTLGIDAVFGSAA